MSTYKSSNRCKLDRLSYAIMISTTMSTNLVSAQEPTAEVEEVVVTGSYIRNSRFSQNNPVDTVSAADIAESGAPDLGNYIRDLTYTSNTNTVNNVNAGSSGNQNAFGATFNLRGLGESSTLTLVDGVRTIDSAVDYLLPDIAIERMEVVLDGGSALYGSDAVAGVVNMIPIKDFDGLRLSTFYQTDEGGGYEQPKIGALYGRSFANGDIQWVIAGDYGVRTPLMNYERPRTLRADFSWNPASNPGVWRRLSGASNVIGGLHGGQQVGPQLRDPSCGTFNEVTDLGAKLNNPSGIARGTNECYYTYAASWPLADGSEDYNVYQNAAWEVSSQLRLEATMNYTWRKNDNRNNGAYPSAFNNRNVLVVSENHPDNPFGVEVGPHLWRPYARSGTEPSHWESGNRLQSEIDKIQRYKFGGSYDFGNSWSAYGYISTQQLRQHRDHSLIYMDRLQLALLGQGGPNRNEWYNPFGSADPRSPFYIAGETDNSQALMDYIFEPVNNVLSESSDLDIFELTATGNVFALPAGDIAMATGIQVRDYKEKSLNDPYALAGNSYNQSLADSVPVNATYESKVQAAFLELEAPIFSNLAVQMAVRHENFTSFDLKTTTPKIALRWEALPDLAFRGSWGESFLAPSASNARPFDPNENCGEIFSGNDPLTGQTLQGGTSCASGNPDLRPETSEIWNLGFTWEPLDVLSLSLDYQTIEYSDRIRTLGNEDMARNEFKAMLAAIGSSEATYSSAPGSATREAANAWVASVGDPRVSRNPVTQRVERVVRQAGNVNTVWVDLVDARVQYELATGDLGTFTTTLSGSSYTKYEYKAGENDIQDALGLQNWNTGIVPPVPKFKGSLRVNWFLDNHSANINTSYTSAVTFDGSVNNLLTGIPAPSSGEVHAWSETNIQYAYVLDSFFDSEFTISLGVRNVFDKLPQLLPLVGGFESRLHTPWGRQFWASVNWSPM